MDLTAKIKQLAHKKNAIILAHNYQNSEIQDIADITGDSLELARKAADTSAAMIVFCGVHFMAESAKILSPHKTVILPAPDAGCPMADMADSDDIIELKKQHPHAKVVTYINSSAAAKAVSDVICTSSNAQRIVERIDGDEILFVPDKNLASYVQRFTAKKIIPWQGFCPTHERFAKEDLALVKSKHPDGLVIVHPECRPEVVDLADEVLSTGGMVEFVKKTAVRKIIVGTELGMIHKLHSVAPHITYIPAADNFICPNMKKITLDILYNALLTDQTQITVDPAVAAQAKKALDLMLKLS